MSKSPSLRRIQADIRELAIDPSEQYYAAPLENDMFEWHFTIRGAEGTDFEGGIYHGRILLPVEYPYKPPHIIFLTPSGRFETNTKVCLSFSAFHPELWQPAWGIRLILEALISFLPTPADGALGALDYKPEERKRLAKQSQSFCCPICGPVAKLLPKRDLDPNKAAKRSGPSRAFSKEVAELQRLQQERGGFIKESQHTANSEKKEQAIATNAIDVREEAKQKTDADNTESKEEIPNVLSSDTNNDNQDGALTTEEDSNGALSHTASNAAIAESNDTIADTDSISGGNSGSLLNAAGNLNEIDNDAAVNDLSLLYDHLLNISILLMLVTCVMLWKKGVELYRELNVLRATPIVGTFLSNEL